MRWIESTVVVLAMLCLWTAVTSIFDIPGYVFPSPGEVLNEFVAQPVSLVNHLLLTLAEATVGLLVAWLFAFALSAILFVLPRFERAVLPAIVGFKAIPLIAIAPLLILWFGNGFASKCVMAATISFFPLLLNYLKGYRACSDDEVMFLKTVELSRWSELARFRYFKATPYWLAGLRVASVLAVVGAIVAEFSGANTGLGYIVIVSSVRIDTPLLFAGIILCALCGVILYAATTLIEFLVLKRLRMDPLIG